MDLIITKILYNFIWKEKEYESNKNRELHQWKKKKQNLTQSELAEKLAVSNKTVSDEKMLDMLNRIQSLEKEKKTITGILLIFLGICCYLISSTLGRSDVKDFFSGVLVGLSSVKC